MNLVLQRSARVLVHDLVIFVPARYVSKGRNKFHQTTYQDLSQRKGAKFGEGSSVKANWLCIGCPKLVGSKMEGNSNRGHFCKSAASSYHFFTISCLATISMYAACAGVAASLDAE